MNNVPQNHLIPNLVPNLSGQSQKRRIRLLLACLPVSFVPFRLGGEDLGILSGIGVKEKFLETGEEFWVVIKEAGHLVVDFLEGARVGFVIANDFVEFIGDVPTLVLQLFLGGLLAMGFYDIGIMVK